MLQEVKRIPVSIAEARNAVAGQIILGVSPLSPVSIHHFPRIYRPFHRAFPEVRIEVLENEALHLADQVRKSQVDLALTPLPLFTTKVQFEPPWSEELWPFPVRTKISETPSPWCRCAIAILCL